jgi:hypothetical protein
MSKIREYPNGGYPWLNGGNPEHRCPETGEPALCYHKACDEVKEFASRKEN